MDPVPVLVVGAGPVGMVTALALARQGVSCVLVDQGFETSVHPKLDYVNSRSMEFLRQLGIADDVRAAGVAPEHRADVIWSTGLAGEPITTWGLPSVDEEWRRIAEQNDGTQPTEPGQRISQIDLEPVLRAHCRRSPLVDLRCGLRFDSLTQDDDTVTSHLVDVLTDQPVRLRSRYVIGCDGASSQVRRAVGIGEEGFDVPGLPGAFMVHFKSRDLDSLHRHGRFWHYFAFRYIIIAQDEVDTWTAHVNGMDASEFDTPPADPAAFLLDTMRTDLKIDKVLLTSRWRPGFMIADRYRAGRVLLAGDSAHRMFPTGAYGMNTGIGDAVDAAWKIAALVRGFGGPGLLDSYETERRPVGLRTMHTSHRHLGVHLKAGALLREGAPPDAVAAFLTAERGENEYRGIELGYRYGDSPVVCHDDAPEPPWSPREYTPTTWPGGRPPSLVLDDGEPIYDRFAPSFTLVDFVGDGRADPLLDAAAAQGVPVSHTVVTDAGARQVWERDLVLLRPDHHVAWRGNRADLDPAAVIRRVRGAR
ncbi:FAD-dependent monooxygenase [Micromonospora sagamiensis]|uniref:2-polyprenyl-6-methoxyphenol hydroxylase-like FAD-dependent oxidoreductase n=1 Tax=Micromonospora sagamiensis TaxID=47875 RepID=A0A562WDM4_9ACTN|nr:FAD-dependent monooxygenase [Micromonospora sagamiensis]TWJ27674.1 2-polyprenyl-6-methoxyphenol hydroxylase-like FAD-dependent oxidoreductase [Micromonospora sagamiensis]BCL13440.1 monooxygenase [Micromonospora sagamiensis]